MWIGKCVFSYASSRVRLKGYRSVWTASRRLLAPGNLEGKARGRSQSEAAASIIGEREGDGESGVLFLRSAECIFKLSHESPASLARSQLLRNF